jgi:hypothetical protein
MHALAPMALALMVAAEDGGVELNGFLSNRAQLTLPSSDALLSTKNVPIFADLSEVNAQVKARFFDEKLRFGVDYSIFVLAAGGYADADAESGALKWIDSDDDDEERDIASAFVALSEAYASIEPIEHLVLTVGKKRTVWSPGLAFSPTDLLNPLRDPSDPSLQRAGFWHARVDVPFELFTITALFAPQVLAEQSAVPTRLFIDDDDELHYSAALRGYALVGEADVNAWLLWSHQHGDAFENKPRLAVTLSQSLFSIHELHAELLLQTGSTRGTVAPECVETQQTLGACAFFQQPIVTQELLDSDFVYPDILVGWRTMPDDGSMIAVEYLYQADGYLRAEFDDVARLLAFVGRFQRAGQDVPVPSTQGANAGSGTSAVPTRLSFQPLRRHYLFFTYTKPQVLDDFTLSTTMITPVEDLSVLATGSISWAAQQWLTLSLFGFVPIASPARVSADMSGDPWQAFYEAVPEDARGFVPRGALIKGKPTGEFDMAPFEAQLMFEARAFF